MIAPADFGCCGTCRHYMEAPAEYCREHGIEISEDATCPEYERREEDR